MKPKELHRRALKVIEMAADECPKPEGLDLLLTAEQLLIAADDIEGMARPKSGPVRPR
jgi:hypothetical protein